MPMFEIERYELHVRKHRIEATSEAEAVKKLLDGEAQAVDGGLEFIEVAGDFGLPLDENQDLAEELQALGVNFGEDVIPSIRSITEA